MQSILESAPHGVVLYDGPYSVLQVMPLGKENGAPGEHGGEGVEGQPHPVSRLTHHGKDQIIHLTLICVQMEMVQKMFHSLRAVSGAQISTEFGLGYN